jgi:hypothetical protein
MKMLLTSSPSRATHPAAAIIGGAEDNVGEQMSVEDHFLFILVVLR